MVRRWWERRYAYRRVDVDRMRWPHPRPAKDPRIVGLNIAIAAMAIIQTICGAAPTTVSARAFSPAAQIATTLLFVTAAGLVIGAAFCRSQYVSFGVELGGCLAWVGAYLIQWVALTSVNPGDWPTTTSLAWIIGYGGGNAVRAFILFRRLW